MNYKTLYNYILTQLQMLFYSPCFRCNILIRYCPYMCKIVALSRNILIVLLLNTYFLKRHVVFLTQQGSQREPSVRTLRF